MNLVVDTSVWSLVLRRRSVDPDNPWVTAFRGHVAACVENGFPLLTADQDFVRIARHSNLIVLPPLS